MKKSNHLYRFVFILPGIILLLAMFAFPSQAVKGQFVLAPEGLTEFHAPGIVEQTGDNIAYLFSRWRLLTPIPDKIEHMGSSPAEPIHSLQHSSANSFDYPNFSNAADLSFVGSSTVTNNRLRLTSSDPWFQVGGVWYGDKQPVQAGFETTFTFEITGSGGDGFAFVIHNSAAGDSALGDSGCYLGYGYMHNALAIEFDTFRNDYYCADIADLDNNHISIQSGGHGTIYPHQTYPYTLATNPAPVDLRAGAHSVRIVYQPGLLQLFLNEDPMPVVTTAVDLSALLDLDDGSAWVGFVAATGLFTQDHDILSWSFNADSQPDCGPGINPNGWQTAVPLPQPMSTPFDWAGEELFVHNGRLYLFGGRHGNPITNIYYNDLNPDGTPGSWYTANATLPATYYDHDVVRIGDHAYFISGANGAVDVWYAAIDNLNQFNPWQQTNNPPGRQNFALAATDQYLYISGGDSGGSLDSVHVTTVNVDGSLAPWTSTHSLPQPIQGHAMVVHEHTLYVLSPQTDALYYAAIDPATGQLVDNWQIADIGLPRSMLNLTAFVHNEYLYLMGGPDHFEMDLFYSQIEADGSLTQWSPTTSLPFMEHREGMWSGGNGCTLYALGGHQPHSGDWGNYYDEVYFAVLETTPLPPTLLLVNGDNNSISGSLGWYTDSLDFIGVRYEVWDVAASGEPTAADLAAYEYDTVIWFSGDAGTPAGPGPAAEAALATWLMNGDKSLFISSSAYHADRGLTPFMMDHLGVISVTNQLDYLTVSADGPLGDFSTYPLPSLGNVKAAITGTSAVEILFYTEDGGYRNAAIGYDAGSYRTTYWGFPFEILDSPDTSEILRSTLNWLAGEVRYAGPVDVYNSSLGLDNGVAIARLDSVGLTGWLRDQDGNPIMQRQFDIYGQGYETGRHYMGTALTNNAGELYFAFTWPDVENVEIILYDPVYQEDIYFFNNIVFYSGPPAPLFSYYEFSAYEIPINVHGVDNYAVITTTLVSVSGHPFSGEVELWVDDVGYDSSWDAEDGLAIMEFTRIYPTTVDVRLRSSDEYESAGYPSIEVWWENGIRFVPGSIDLGYSYADAYPTEILADGIDVSTIYAALYDTYENYVTNREIELWANGQYIDSAYSNQYGEVAFDLSWSEVEWVYPVLYDPLYDTYIDVYTYNGGLNFISGPIDLSHPNTAISVSPNPAFAGVDEVWVNAYLYTTSGHPAADRPFYLYTNGSPSEYNYTDLDGNISFYFYPEYAGEISLSLYDVEYSFETDSIDTLTVLAGFADFYNSTITAEPDAIIPDGLDSSLLTATLRDMYGNPLANREILWIVDGDEWHYLDYADTDENGVVTYDLTWDTPEILEIVIYNYLPGRNDDQFLYSDVYLHVVGAGAIALPPSTITITPPETLASGLHTAVISATLRDEDDQFIANRLIDLYWNDSWYQTAYTDDQGHLSFSLTSTNIETATLALYDTVYDVTLPAGTVSFVAGPPSPSASSLEIDEVVLIADGLDAAQLTVTLYDAYNHRLPDVAVAISVTDSVSVTQFSAFSNSQGVVTATVRSATVQEVTIRAVADDILLDDTVSVEFVPGPADPGLSSIDIAPNPLLAGGFQTATITVTLRDASNHPAAGRELQLVVDGTGNHITPAATGVADETGTAVFYLTSDTAESKAVYAIDLAYEVSLPSQSVTFLPGPVVPENSTIVISPLEVTADGVQTAVITATLRDLLHQPVSGRSLELIVGGDEVIISPAAVAEPDENGILIFSLASTAVGVKTIAILDIDYAVTVPAADDVTFVPGPPHPGLSSLTSDRSILTADGSETALLTATLRDAFGHPLPDRSVIISSSGSVTLTQLAPMTDAQGQVQAAMQSSLVQTVTVTATDIAANVTLSQTVLLTFVPGPAVADNSSISITPLSAIANGVELITITAVLRDAFDNPLINRPISLLVDGSNNFISPANPLIADDSGAAVFYLSSTRTENKTISLHDIHGAVTLAAGTVAFTSPAVDADQSQLIVRGSRRVAADGQQTVMIEVTARDHINNPVSGVGVILTSTSPVAFIQPPLTDFSGRATGYVYSTNAVIADISAIVDGMVLPHTVQTVFEGPDLVVTHSGPAAVTAGYPLDYHISVANGGLLTATNVLITQTIPNHTTFISQTSPFTYTHESANTIVWQVDTMAAGTAVSFDVAVQAAGSAPIGSHLISQVQAAATEPEINVDNNLAAVTTVAQAPAPNLAVAPGYPTLVVDEGLSNTLLLEVRNQGTAVLQNATIVLPPHMPWVTLGQTSLGDLLPGESVTVSLTADAINVGQNGYYRDRVRVNSDNAGGFDVLLTVMVQAPARDLSLTLNNDLDTAVANARVILTESIYIETEGNPGSDTFYREGYTDASGHLTFQVLASGKSYNYQINATNHDNQTGSVYVTTGSGAQAWDVVMTGRPALTVQPAQVKFDMLRGSLRQQTMVLRNTGSAPVTDISLTAADIPFLYLGQLPVGTVLAPGQTAAVTVNAAPLLTETIGIDIYQGSITVNSSAGPMATAPVTVNLLDVYARTLCVKVETDRGDPLTQAMIRVTDLAGQIVASGSVTETIQHVYTQSSDNDGPGYSCFQDLKPGPYHIDIGRGDIRLGQANVEVVVGDGIQEEVIVVAEPSVTASFLIVPTSIEDVYTTVFTLTFIPHEAPRLALSPQRINLCGSDDGVVNQAITLHNFYPITLTNAFLDLEFYGNVNVQVTHPDGTLYTDGSQPLPIGTIPPNTHMQFDLQASVNMAACDGDTGTILIRVEAEHHHYVPESWYRIDATPGFVAPGQSVQIPMRLANVGFPQSSNLNSIPPTLENITLVPPQNLTWITTSVTLIDEIFVGEEVAFDLIVEPPEWLPQGIYYDQIQIFATNGITALIGIEAEMTAQGLRVETQFVTPLTAGQGGTPPPPPDNPPPVSQPQPPWDNIVTNWNPDVFGPQDVVLGSWHMVVGCYCSDGGGGSWSVVGNRLVSTLTGTGTPFGNSSFAYSPDFKDNVVVLQLQQRFSLDREAFNAYLSLNNALSEDITDVEITLLFQSGSSGELVTLRTPDMPITATGTFTPVLPGNSVIPITELTAGLPARWQKLYPVNFMVIPEAPTAVGTVAGGSNRLINWTFIPDAPGLTEQAYFDVRAIIRYRVNGEERELVTTASQISVSPQPRIVLDYYLPNYVLGGETFDWLVVATNIGYGTARNFRVETPQPKIIRQSERYPTDFTLIGPSTLNWGDVAPGQQVSGTWRILPSNPGSFVDWAAECKHQNYMGVTLPPLVYCEPRVHFLDTSYLAESQQWGKGDSCFSGLFQAFDSDPVNTFSGNFTYSYPDLNIPTWGPPLEFIRSYNSRDTRAGPLGAGWTHNYDLDLKYESFIGIDEDGIIGQQTYFAARLPHGSIVYFNVSPDGETITPFPGVRATLTRDFTTYRLTLDCEQTVYTYNAQQKLASIEDANGNQVTLSYDGNGNLTAVTGSAGRQLTFEYDTSGLLTHLTDPMGRSTTYTYTLGYLSSMADFRGQVSTFHYTLPGTQQPGHLVSRTDPNGYIEFYNHYSEDGRVLWQDDALGNRTTFVYALDPDTGGRTTTMTDPLGNVTIDAYDEDGLLVRRTDSLGYSETFAYDANNNPIRIIDKNGHVTLYGWDECLCDKDRIVDAMGNTTVMTFDDKNQLTSLTDPRGQATIFSYDEHTNLTAVTNPLGHIKTYTYGPHGELVAQTDENGNTIGYAYDLWGNMAVVTDALGYATHMEYDLVGRIISSTDALNRTTLYEYDAGDNLLLLTKPDSTTWQFTYDNAGNQVTAIDPLGRMTTYLYDGRHQVTEIINPAGEPRYFTYDANRNLVSQTDENGHAISYQPHGLGLNAAIVDPLGGVTDHLYDPVGNLLATTDPNGNVTQYSYDPNNRVVATIYPNDSQMTALYDEAGNLLSLTDGENRTVAYVYDELGRVISETDPLGGITTYTYDAAGNIIKIEDAAGRETEYTYDPMHRLTEITDPLQGITRFEYDPVGNQTRIIDASGRATSFVYNIMNRLIMATDPLSGTIVYEYDAVGNQTAVIDPLNRRTEITYDDLDQPVALLNPAGHSVTYSYDAVGNLVQLVDEEGRTTFFAYDGLNRITTLTNTMGGLFSFVYDLNGNLVSETDSEGRTTSYGYDAFNQLITVTNPLGDTTIYTYDGVGNLVHSADANGNMTQYIYDALDRLVEMRDAAFNPTLFAYDAVGNLLLQTDAEGNTVALAYDALDRLLVMTNAAGDTISHSYDAVGNLLTITDEEGRLSTFVYDALDRPVQHIDPLGHTTVFTYDAVGNQLSITDAKGQVTTLEYDSLNQPLRSTDPLGGMTSFTYSPAGNLLTLENPLGQVVSYGYDELDRPVEMVDPLGNVIAYTYDEIGNLLNVTDALNRTTNFVYDPLDRLVQVINPLAGVSTFTYDGVGNRLTATDANEHTVHYAYDSLNRLTAVTDPLLHVTTFTYDRVGNQLTLTDPLSRTTSYQYDSLYRLVTITDPAGNQAAFAYDRVGNQTSMIDEEGRSSTAVYDALNRPVMITNPLSGTLQLVYDEVGNLSNQIDAAGRVVTYTYDALDRMLTTVDPLGQATIYEYDALGNIIRLTDPLGRITNFQYDDRNLLVQATDSLSGTTTLEYDALGNLVREIDPLGNETHYTLDALDRIIAVTDALNNSTSYAYDPVGNLLAITNANNQTTQLSYDPLNRMQTVTDPLGQTAHYFYDAVGNNIAIVDPLGRQTAFSYDLLDRLATVTDPLNRVTSYSYDNVGNPTSLVDAAGMATHYQYDGLDRLVAVTENHVPGLPQNNFTNVTTQFNYDAVGNLTGIVNPLGNTLTLEYDPLDRLTHLVDALNLATSFHYDAVGNLTQAVDPNGNATLYQYDPLNRLAAITRPDEGVQFSYDAVGNRLTMNDATGLTAYAYDSLYRPTSMTDPLGQVVQYGYDAVGNRTQLVYPDGHQATYTYDPANRLVAVTDWDNGLTQYDYDAVGRLAEMILPNGVTGSFNYDAADQLTLLQYEDALTGTLASYAYGYDAVGNRIQAIETLLSVEEIGPPIANFAAAPLVGIAPLSVVFVNQSTQADSLTWHYGDGEVGHATTLTHTHIYEQPGLYTVTLAATNEFATHILTRTDYILVVPADAFWESDGLLVVEAEHSHANLPRNEQSWLPQTGLEGYTGDGYLQLLPERGALYAADYADSSPELQYQAYFTNPGLYYVWVYGAGVNAAGDSLHVGLDGLPHAGSQAITGFAFNQWSWSDQTMAGSRASLLIPAPGLYTINVWAREDGMRLDRILLALDGSYLPAEGAPLESGRASTINFDQVARPYSTTTSQLLLEAAPATAESTERDRRFIWLAALILANPGIMLMAPLALLAPLANNRRRRRLIQSLTVVFIALSVAGTGIALIYGGNINTAVAWQVTSISEPPLNRSRWHPATALFAADDSRSTASTLAVLEETGLTLDDLLQTAETKVIEYNYDPLYRLTEATYNNGESFAYTYDAAGNRLTAAVNGVLLATYGYDVANRLIQVNGDAFIYDNNGNLLADGEYSYQYDSANRLTQMDNGISTADYIYNGDGLRVAQIMDGIRTDYVQDVAAPLPQVLSARQGGTVSNYLRGMGLIGEQRGGTGPVAPPPTWHYHLPDVLGSVRQVTDAQGQVTLLQEFDPFGSIRERVGDTVSAYGFAGEEQDPNSDHLYLRARTYHPAHGRFLQQDTVLGDPTQPRSLHRYAYAFNNPVNYTDPSGHMPHTESSGLSSGRSASAPVVSGSGGGLSLMSSSPLRSVNNGVPAIFTNNSQQTGNHRPFLCGVADVLGSVAEWVMNNPDTAIGIAIIGAAIFFTGGAAIPAILIGAGMGAGIGLGMQMWHNLEQERGLFENINWSLVGMAAFQGAVSGAAAALVTPLLPIGGSGLAKVGAVAFTGLVQGRVSHVAVNLASGQPWHTDLWNPSSRDWWVSIGLDVVPGVVATNYKGIWRATKQGISSAAGLGAKAIGGTANIASSALKHGGEAFNKSLPGWWFKTTRELTQVRGTRAMVVTGSKWAADLAGRSMRGTVDLTRWLAQGARTPGRLLDDIRFGLRTFRDSGILPHHAVRIRNYAAQHNLTIAFRTTKPWAGLWNLLGVPAKPMGWGLDYTPPLKSNRWGLAFDPQNTGSPVIRGDYDLAVIMGPGGRGQGHPGRQMYTDSQVSALVPDLDAAVSGIRRGGLRQVMHPTHWTYKDAHKLGHPGDLFVFTPDRGGRFIAHKDVRAFAESHALPWKFDCSFTADTIVSTEEGPRAISTLAAGEMVLAFSEVTDSVGYYPIAAIWIHDDTTQIHLTVDGEEIETTPDHPFLTDQGVWVNAENLRIGEGLRHARGEGGVIEAIALVEQPQTMYNLTVETAHTYFVGYGQWLVHNTCYRKTFFDAHPTLKVE